MQNQAVSPNPSDAERKPWWKGARGEWLAIAQVILAGLIFLGPRTVAGQPEWPFPFPLVCLIAGGVLMLGGCVLLVAGIVCLGGALTPLPYPKEGARLIQRGPYALVRHPMYCGGLALALGWTLIVRGWLTLAWVVVLFVLLDVKSRREETWLGERFSAYESYKLRVRKLIPFVY